MKPFLEMFVAAFHHRFPSQPIELRDGEYPVAAIPARHPETGGIEIMADGEFGLIVEIVNFTHGHFDDFDVNRTATERQTSIIEIVLNFLADVFADRVAFFGNQTDGGGWWYLAAAGEAAINPAGPHFVWSGPVIQQIVE